MNNHKIIVKLITELSLSEAKSLAKELKKYPENDNKLFQLFNLIKSKKKLIQSDIIQILYGGQESNNSEAYRKLCERLINKILVVFADFEVFNQNKNAYSEYYFTRTYCNKNMYLVQFFNSMKFPHEWVFRFVYKNLALCDKFEFIEESIVFERYLFLQYAILNKVEFLNPHILELERRCEGLVFLQKTDLIIYKFIDRVQHKSIDDKSKINEMKLAIREIEGYFCETNLQTINFNLLMLKLQLAHFEEKYNKAELLIFELIRISELYPPLKRRGRILQNYMNLAFTQFYLYKFKEASLNALKSTIECEDVINVLNMRIEAYVFALFYLQKYDEGVEWMNKVLSSGVEGNNPEQLSKRHAMMAFLKYLQGDYKTAFKHLQLTKEVETDREGWNLGIRMLNIYLTLSTEKVDLADQRINAMRKHIERTSKMRNLRKRDIIIFRILSHLSRSGFDFEEVWEERKKDFALLRSNTPDCNWVPRSHELIIFDQWFEAKMKNKPYVPVFPSPKTEYEEEAVDISQMESV